MTTHAPLRSRRTKAESVCHVRGLGNGDAPTSPIKIQGCWRRLQCEVRRGRLGSQSLCGDAGGAEVLFAGQMGDAGDDLVGHEVHRVVPGIAVPHVVEAE